MSDRTIVTVGTDRTLVTVGSDSTTIETGVDRSVIVSTAPVGPRGPAGASGVYVGTTAPSDTSLIWFDIS